MTNIPQSQWVIQKNYFTVSPVDNFELLYLEWVEKENPFCDLSEDVKSFAEKISKNDFIQIYEYPHENEVKDYFEIVDDNHVIPRHLFNLVEAI